MRLLLNVDVDVDDIDRAIDFYRDAFGLHLRRRLFDGLVAEMVGGSSIIYLLTKPAGTLPASEISAARDYRRHWTPVHIDFEVEDIGQAVQRAVEAGAKLEDAPRSFNWGQLAMLSDPFGHGFCLIQFSDQGYGAVACDLQPSRHLT